MGLLVGMVETTSAAVAQVLDQLLDRPRQLADATAAAGAGDDGALSAHVWEALRFNPINAFAGRVCVQPYTIAAGTKHATAVPPGAFMLVAGRSAMRDADAVPDPEAFRLDRPSHAYIHFGHGPHTCLGAQINLVQIPEIVKALLLAGPSRAEGPAGRLDFQGGPFPERFDVTLAGEG
jgi:cytochrome P450